MINFRQIIRINGILLALLGVMMLLVLPCSWYFQSGDAGAIALSGAICILLGLPVFFAIKSSENSIHRRDGFLIVTSGWVLLAFAGTLPYLLSGSIPELYNAFFETMSGMTTTGASILEDIEAMPKGILLWRSLTQWIGGMGIIVLTVAIFPLLGMGGVELFTAEAPGPTSDKIHPRIQETAKRLWLIYVALTAGLMVLLHKAGMSVFDAVNHSLTTMATGGFSTKNASIAAFDSPVIHYIITVFMFVAGINYSVTYLAIKGRFSRVFSDDELRAYTRAAVALIFVFTIAVAYQYYVQQGVPNLELAFRQSAFTVVSLMTTTGFVLADYTAWPPAVIMLCFVLLFVGGSAGSTAGGIKFIRHLVFIKNTLLEFKRQVHPRAVVPLKINGELVSGRIITHVIIFLLLYLITFIIGAICMGIMGYDFETSLGAVATSLGNVGPAIGKVGPMDNFAWLSPSAKWFLSALMLMGRLELFTVLILFTPYYWRSN